MFASVALLLALSAGAAENNARIHQKTLEVAIYNEADARTLFDALAQAQERIMDSGVERLSVIKSDHDAIKLRCVGNNRHACNVQVRNRTGEFGDLAKGVELTLSDALSGVLFKLLELPTRPAGHTALKTYATHDKLLDLTCAYHAGSPGPRCWIKVRK